MTSSRALGFAIALTLAVGAAHGQSPPTFSAHELLDAHNSARARVGCPPLAWSRGLAGEAKHWADQLLASHTFAQQPNDPHGENLFLISSGIVTSAEVVQTWVAERGDYNPDANTCAGVCGHYTSRPKDRLFGGADSRIGLSRILSASHGDLHREDRNGQADRDHPF